MIHLMKYKVWYVIFSMVIILPGLFYLLTSGLKLGIDFTGGGLLEYQFEQKAATTSAQLKSDEQIKQNLSQYGDVIQSAPRTFMIRTKPMDETELKSLKEKIASDDGQFIARSEENVGPVIGKELEQKALIALGLASLAIVGYITFAFRKVPKPASSWRFGIATIIALLHDVLVVLGVFAFLGKYYGVEVDSLFVTAVLTIIGFSVHDTIVVFDRIRENLPKYMSHKFLEVADISVTQTLARSLNTSLTVVFVLLALLLFGGETIRWFVVALLVGIISGTYSSIFNATAILVWWEEKLGH